MIQKIRSQQVYQQVAAIRPVSRESVQIATYSERLATTGQRRLITADGGTVTAQHIGINQPTTTAVVISSGKINSPSTMLIK